MSSRWCNATAFVLTAYAVGCGSEVIVERNDARPAGPPRCHAGYHFVDGVCQVIEVYFAGGTFVMGRNYCPNPIEATFIEDPRCDLRDEPHTVSVGPFAMDAVEVTSAEAERPDLLATCPILSTECLSASYWEPVGSGANGGGRPPLEAEAICARRGMTLPNEAQWEYAASAAGTRTYPWGDAPPSCDVVRLYHAGCPTIDAEHPEVARYPPSPEGLYDLAGNVAEQVLYDERFGAPGYPDTARIFTKCGEWSFCKQLITRGGYNAGQGFPETLNKLRAAHRGTDFSGPGFRCVRNL